MSAPVVDDLASFCLERVPMCECPHDGHGCPEQATNRLRVFHMTEHKCQPFLALLCTRCARTTVQGCLELLDHLAAHHALPHPCIACEQPITAIHDLVEVRSL